MKLDKACSHIFLYSCHTNFGLSKEMEVNIYGFIWCKM